MKRKWRIKVINGKIIHKEPDLFDMFLSTLPEDCQLVIDKYRKQRSLNQNAYYWACCVQTLSNELGYTQSEMHSILVGKYLSNEFEFEGEKYLHIRSTTDLNTVEFEEYLVKVRGFGTERKISIPLPNEIEF